MDNTLQISTVAGSRNVDEFYLIDSEGIPSINFNNYLAPLVTVEVHNPDGANWTINSTTDAVNFSNTKIEVMFGKLNLPKGRYYPKIYFTHNGSPDPFIFTAQQFTTEILLHAYE